MAAAPGRGTTHSSYAHPDAQPASLLRWLAEPLRELTSREILLLVLLLLLAFALRVYRLDQESFWEDPAGSVYMAKHSSLGELISRDEEGHVLGHPPAYEAMLGWWIAVFGQSMIAVRLSSVVMGVLSVFGLFLLALRMSGKRVAFVATTLASFSFMHVYFSQEPRPYALILLQATLSMLILYYLLEKQSFPLLLFFTVINALGLYTFYFYLYFLMAHMAVALVESPNRRAFFGISASTLLSVGLFLPGAIAILPWEWSQRTVYNTLLPLSMQKLGDLIKDYIALRRPSMFTNVPTFPWLTEVAILAALLIGAASLRAIRERRVRVCLIYLVFPLLLFRVAELFLGPMLLGESNIMYFFIFTLPAFHLLLSHTLASLKKPLALTLLVVFLLPSLWGLYYHYSVKTDRDWRGAAAHLAATHAPGTRVIVYPRFLFWSLSQALPEGWPQRFEELEGFNFSAVDSYLTIVLEERPTEFVLISTRYNLGFENPDEFKPPEGGPLRDYELRNASLFTGVYIGHYVRRGGDSPSS